jgi:protein-L-isoaspartate(D-aspartate) O-methyltransferase
VGCSVAIDAARRDPTLRVVAVLSPGTNYLGIDTLEHLSDWGDRTLLIVSSEEEWPTGAKQIQAQFEQSSTSAGDTDQPALDTWLLTGTGREVHGTRMLGRVDGIEGRLGDWFLQKLSPRKAPDPEVKPGGGDAGEAEEAHAPDNARVEATSQGAPEIDEPWRPPQPPAAEKRSDERAIMVSSQMASPSDFRTPVRDERVLAAIKAVPRHAFVPRSRQDLAYQDTPLPIGHGQTISQPYIVGLMSEQLNIDEHSKVLEIGTGSGYQAAVLAHLTPHVYSVEIIEPLAERAKATLSAQGYSQIKLRRGDGYHGWPEMGPYDAIIVTCAAGHLPPPLWEQLSPGGRIVIPIGGRYESQRLVVLEKLQDGSRRSKTVTGVRFVPLTREQGS